MAFFWKKSKNSIFTQPKQQMDLQPLVLEQLSQQILRKTSDNEGATIELVNVSKKYEGNHKNTLENINLKIPAKKFCIFLGPSGCGKTTLLRMIAGLNSITSGDLLFNNKRFNNLSASERNIAMVFQSYALYPHMNVYSNMAFGLKINRERKDIIDQRIKDVAKILKIENYLYAKPRDLSGGQRQRVAIGRAIARKPSVFLMDEPLSNLDAKLREIMRREIINIHRLLNTTSIYVTHDQLEAMTMGDVIVVLNNGAIQQNGPPKELYFAPQNLFVARFIGSPTMNLFEGYYENGYFQSKQIPNWKFALKTTTTSLANKALITLGFRTEDVFIDANTGLEAIIFNIESLGREQTLVAKINDEVEVSITVSNTINYELYQKIYLQFNQNRYHLFDTTNEKKIN